MSDACATVIPIALDGSEALEAFQVPLFISSLYTRCKIDHEGQVIDSTDPVNERIRFQTDAFIPFEGMKIDKYGNIYDKVRKVHAKTSEYPKMKDKAGFRAIPVRLIRETTIKHLGWPANRIRLMLPSGEILLHDETLIRYSAVCLAFLEPWRVQVSVSLQPFGGEGVVRYDPDDLEIETELPGSLGQATLDELERRICMRVGLPMIAFEAQDADDAPGDASPFPGRRQQVVGAFDLVALGVRGVRFSLRPAFLRLLVELRNRDTLWGAARRGGTPLPLAQLLRPRDREISLAEARELFGAPCIVAGGELTLGPSVLGDDPLHVHVSLRGPRGTSYEGMHWVLDMELPHEWPGRPPLARFVAPVPYHCNVQEDGQFLSSAFGIYEDEWPSSSTIFDFLAKVLLRLQLPDADASEPGAVRPELAAQLRADPDAYSNATARQTAWARQTAQSNA